MTDASNSERRRENRHIACYPVDLQREGGDQELSLIRDLSTTGALLFTRKQHNPGERLALELHLGDGPDGLARVEGQVVRGNRHPPGQGIWRYSIAVEFTRALDDHREAIEKLSRSLPTDAGQ